MKLLNSGDWSAKVDGEFERVSFTFQRNGVTLYIPQGFFAEVAEAFREEQHRVHVFSNMEALYAALSLTQSPSALHTPRFAEVVIADAGRDKTGQSNIVVTCSCGKVHTIHTHGDLDTFRSQWYKPVMEGI